MHLKSNAAGVDALGNEPLTHRLGTTRGQFLVECSTALVVGMTFNDDGRVRNLLQPPRLCCQQRSCPRAELRAAVAEENTIADEQSKILLGRTRHARLADPGVLRTSSPAGRWRRSAKVDGHMRTAVPLDAAWTLPGTL